MRIRRWLVYVLSAGLGALFVGFLAGYLYLFRSEVDHNPALGEITYHYRWGRPYLITVDQDRDGRDDARVIVDAPFGLYSTYITVACEYWEVRNDGKGFKRHVLLQNGRITVVELDEDGDGKYEKRLEGKAASEFYATRDPSSLDY